MICGENTFPPLRPRRDSREFGSAQRADPVVGRVALLRGTRIDVESRSM